MNEKVKAWWSEDGKWFCLLVNDGISQATVSLTPEELQSAIIDRLTGAQASMLDVSKLSEKSIADIRSHIAGLSEGSSHYETPRLGWTCFHCGENFRTQESAALHFGKPTDERPVCTRAQAGSAPDGKVPERETAWLVERKVTPPQYVSTRSEYADFTNDAWRAIRFATEREAFDFRLRMVRRDECEVVEHMFINKPSPVSPSPPVQEQKK